MKRHTLNNTVLVYSDFDSETRIIVTIPQHVLNSVTISELDFEILAAIQKILDCCERETPLTVPVHKNCETPRKTRKRATYTNKRETRTLTDTHPDYLSRSI